MDRDIRILILEDRESDAELAARELRKGGLRFTWRRVDTKDAFVNELSKFAPDLILADYSLPSFDGLSALELRQELCAGVPFVLVSATLGEDLAIETLKRGATDYVLKDRISRLAPAVKRALVEAEERRQRKRAEAEKRELEEQLYHSQKMEALGQLAGGIAHDFNNRLTAIINYGFILKTKLGGDEQLKAYVENILSSCDKATALIQDLLAFSRKQTVRLKPVDINDVVSGVGRLLAMVIGENIELTTAPHGGELVVLCDSGTLENVLINLATNARDAMPGGGRLTIATGPAGPDEAVALESSLRPGCSYAFISVEDTGRGMDDNTRKRIFEPFFTTKEVGRGTGLGLAMVYGVVKQHDGYITVMSKPGAGTAFRIFLPLAESRTGRDEAREYSPLMGGSETLLLAEDDADVRLATKLILEDFGYRVIEASDGEDAVGKFQRHADRIDLLILDLVMPRRNGKDAYREMANIRPGVKALFTSGYTDGILHKSDLLDEGFHFLSKPAQAAELLRKVRDALNGR